LIVLVHPYTEETEGGRLLLYNNDMNKFHRIERHELEEAIKIVVETGKASTALLQRRLQGDYLHARDIRDLMTEIGVISGDIGNQPRVSLISTYDEGIDKLNRHLAHLKNPMN
jgi:DNA segregation ATPase FtsK/SpoIIIE-like protein